MNIAVHPDSFLNTPGPHGKTCEKDGPIAGRPTELTERMRWEDDGGAVPVGKDRATGSPSMSMAQGVPTIAGKVKKDVGANATGKLTWLQYAGKRSFQEKIKPDHALAKFAVLLGQCRKSVQPAGKAA